MVKGLRELHRRFENIPKKLKKVAEEALEVEAIKLVAQMKLLVPYKDGNLRDSIGWTWGKAPKGSMKVGKVYGKAYGKIAITIYAGNERTIVTNSTGAKFQNALIQEFGTKDVPSSPYFYPTYRANKRRMKAAFTRKINKAIKKL